MAKKDRIRTENLGRFMFYILGHRPYEFGLVPDKDGFVNYKELLWAIHEEDGWSYVRQGSINEVLLGKDRALFESDDKSIRALDRHWELNLNNPSPFLPKILFLPIRRRAHPVAMEKGLRPIAGRYHILSPDRDMAQRIGRRRDQSPVILEVMADKALKGGTAFYPFGDLFLASEIPSRYIAAPPVPKEVVRLRDERPKKKEEKSGDFQAGTFVLDLERDMDRSRRFKGKKKRGWKEETRKYRKKR